MAKTKYTPFLKLKVNEVGAIKALAEDVAAQVIPFFDLPTAPGISSASFRLMVERAARKLENLFGESRPFYLDNFDIPDDVTVDDAPNYQFVVDAFASTSFIPVVGLNRTEAHNDVVFVAKDDSLITSESVAVRLVQEDFEDFDLIESELVELIEAAYNSFDKVILILDCRLCLAANAAQLANQICDFIRAAVDQFDFDEIVVAGSSLPASIGEILQVDTEAKLPRIELQVFEIVKAAADMPDVGLGDYTVVSPMYSDVTLPKEVLPNVMTPKIIYAHKGIHHITRGGALKTHARGNLQYNDMLAYIVSLTMFRGAGYSFGDDFMVEKAVVGGTYVTPSSILKPTINAHITYMVKGHPLTV